MVPDGPGFEICPVYSRLKLPTPRSVGAGKERREGPPDFAVNSQGMEGGYIDTLMMLGGRKEGQHERGGVGKSTCPEQNRPGR